ncbi:MAG TPA: FeoA family protein [bacterium]|nr:FeoA family protein [bacterium]
MFLSDLGNGEKGVVASIDSGLRLFNRLASMGICEGKDITIIKNSGEGPVVIDIEGSRYAIGRGMAEKIVVTKRS